MKAEALSLALLLGVVALSAQDPPPRHDKYRDDPNARCFYSTDGKPYPGNPSMHPCACVQTCGVDDQGQTYTIEDRACELWCTKSRCACHPDEACDMPEVK